MPAVDGVELIRYLAEEGCKAHVMIASGFDSKVIDSVRQLGIERGLSISGTLQKPIRVDTLQAMLEQLRNDDDWLTEKELTRAIDTHALHLLFQPKVKIAAGSANGRLWSHMVGFESLVRWSHPKHGIVPPGDFIPLAESVGLMDPLTELIFTLALEQMKAWNDVGLSVPVSINVSAENLYDVKFADALAARCRAVGVPPAQITIELTETAAMRDVTQAMDILSRLRIKGFDLSMDDFGTGYSSLVQLQRLPFSELKIDQAFARQCAVSDQSRVIVKTMIDMAHNLGLSVIAEGVEDEATMRLLADLRCDAVQGYLIGRPMAADQVATWLGDNKA